MKRLLFIGFCLFFVSPVFAFAQQPYARYCPNPTQIFTGVAQDNTGKPKIELAVDPAFNAKMKAERNTPDLPVTPVYDLVVTVVPTINEYCLPQYDENGSFVKIVDPPDALPFRGNIILGESITSTNVVVGPGSFVRARKNEHGAWQYEWKILGWKDGIAKGDKMEKLIEAIAKQSSINVIVEVAKPDGTKDPKKFQPTFNLCAPVWGSGSIGVVGMRASLEFSTLSKEVEKYTQQGFAEIEPFASTQSSFSHFLDLGKHTDTWYLKRLHLMNKENHTDNLFQGIAKQSACGEKKQLYILFTGADERAVRVGKHITFDGLASYAAHSIIIKPLLPARYAMHEIGHALGDLSDEYIQGDATLRSNMPVETNCVTSTQLGYSYNGRAYGAQDIGGCTVLNLIPSLNKLSEKTPVY